MAEIILDVSGYSQQWVKIALIELAQSKHVKFLSTNHSKYLNEIGKVKELARFFKLMSDKGRLINIDANQCEVRILELEANAAFSSNNDCDDPHLFAMAYLKPTPYLFTKDARLSKCKQCIRNKVDGRYRRFVSICNEKIYRKHRGQIMRP